MWLILDGEQGIDNANTELWASIFSSQLF
jgi:hypothetical protein